MNQRAMRLHRSGLSGWRRAGIDCLSKRDRSAICEQRDHQLNFKHETSRLVWVKTAQKLFSCCPLQLSTQPEKLPAEYPRAQSVSCPFCLLFFFLAAFVCSK